MGIPPACESHQKTRSQSLSIPRKSFAQGEVAPTVHDSSQPQERLLRGFSRFFELRPHDPAARDTCTSGCLIEPLRQILRQPYGKCITHSHQL